jgi:hypothetical protein
MCAGVVKVVFAYTNLATDLVDKKFPLLVLGLFPYYDCIGLPR